MTKSKIQKNVRLPSHITPERYRIMLRPDLKLFTFYGEETIYLRTNKPTREITLHSRDLEIEKVEFKNSFGTHPGKVIYDPKSETATFKFPVTLARGKGELLLVFRGTLNDKMRGFYRSRYIHNGKEKYLATTQFEATDARRAFPCFDEPAHKAVFDVTIIAPANLATISNTLPVEIAEHESGYQLVKFAPTPKMSTYLLAFIVGDFEFIEGKTKEGTLVRVFVTPGKKLQAQFALQTGLKILSFYNRYFGIKYPLPVLDLIAIPDFAAGAMENWGAVTYRETALLVDPDQTSLQNKQWVALVIAHELAHQWFGNLVTMQWWTHLWLNEGFASYIEYVAVDYVFPQWDIWTQFVYNDLGAAFKLDALANTHPIEIEVHNPNEIGEIFDAVSYSKGASIIRMLADFLGERVFRDGLRLYLNKHKYGNAVTADLWSALEKVSGKPVSRVMRSWTQSPGYPILLTEQTPSGLNVTQKRFFSSPISRGKAKDIERWPIPLVYSRIGSSQKLRVLLDARTISLNAAGKVLKLNKGESALLRVRYPDGYLPDLENAVKTKKLGPRDRLGLIRDSFALAEAGDHSADKPLQMSLAYVKETDYTVWLELATGVETVYSLIAGEKYFRHYEQYARKLFSEIGRQVGWKSRKGEPHTSTLLRGLILNQLGKFGQPETVKRARDLFQSQVRLKKAIPPDVRGAVYRIVAANGGTNEHYLLTQMYNKANMSEEKERLSRALASFRQKTLLNKTLQFSLSPAVRLQDAVSIIALVGFNPYGREIMWSFTKKHWKDLVKRYGQGGHLLPRLIQPLGAFTTNARAEEISKFFKSHPAPGGTRAILQTIERIQSNAAWLNRDRTRIEQWLRLRK